MILKLGVKERGLTRGSRFQQGFSFTFCFHLCSSWYLLALSSSFHVVFHWPLLLPLRGGGGYCLRGPVLAGGSLFTPSLCLPPSVAPDAACSCTCSGVQGDGVLLLVFLFARPWVCLSLLHYWHSTVCLLSLRTVFWCLQALLMIKFVYGFSCLCSFVMILKSSTPLSWGCNSPF